MEREGLCQTVSLSAVGKVRNHYKVRNRYKGTGESSCESNHQNNPTANSHLKFQLDQWWRRLCWIEVYSFPIFVFHVLFICIDNWFLNRQFVNFLEVSHKYALDNP